MEGPEGRARLFCVGPMAGELQTAVVALVRRIVDAEIMLTPEWLLRPAAAEYGRRRETVRAIYHELTGLDLPEEMPPRETLRIDAVLDTGREPPRVLEVDEAEHFNQYRALALRSYPEDVETAFPIGRWIEQSEEKTQLEGGEFGRPKPPLFPGRSGGHVQRAFHDTLVDLLPPEHGYRPTLRIGDFEVASWIDGDDAEQRMRSLLRERL